MSRTKKHIEPGAASMIVSATPAPNSSSLYLPPEGDRFLKIREVMSMTGKSRSSIYKAISVGGFPAQVKIGPRSSAWRLREIIEWRQACVQARDRQP